MIQSTSKSANQYMEETGAKVSIADKILQGMRVAGLKEGTYEEIADACRLKYSQVWKRISDLQRRNEIVDSGRTKALTSGRQGIIWKLFEPTNVIQTQLF